MDSQMNCPLCYSNGNKIFSAKLLSKYHVKYYKCENCALIFTEKPYWLSEAYSNPMLWLDTGAVLRNIHNEIIVKTLIDKVFYNNKTFLDYGGGFGLFTRMMRDAGYNFLWYDKYSQNMLAEGFSWTGEKIDMLVCFEVFEHMDDPAANIDKLFDISDNIIFSTELYTASDFPNTNWNYYSSESGQHISFYNQETMKYLANKYQVNFYSISGLHCFTPQKISQQMISELEQDIQTEINSITQITKMNFTNCISDQLYMTEKSKHTLKNK